MLFVCPACVSRFFQQNFPPPANINSVVSIVCVATARVCLQYIFPSAYPRAVAVLLHDVSRLVRNSSFLIDPKLEFFLAFGAVLLLTGKRGVAGDFVSRAFHSPGFVLFDTVYILFFVGFRLFDSFCPLMVLFFCWNDHYQHASFGRAEFCFRGCSSGPCSRCVQDGG